MADDIGTVDRSEGEEMSGWMIVETDIDGVAHRLWCGKCPSQFMLADKSVAGREVWVTTFDASGYICGCCGSGEALGLVPS